MSWQFWVILAGAFILAGGGVALYVAHKRRRLLGRIRFEFGKPPTGASPLSIAERYWRAFLGARPSPHYVDDITWADLDLDEVYNRVNASYSAHGDTKLYEALRTPLEQAPLLPAREAMIQAFAQNPRTREKAQYRLANMGRWGGLGLEAAALRPETLGLKFAPLYWLGLVLPFAIFPFLPLVGPTFALVWCIFALIINFVIHVIAKGHYAEGFHAISYLAASISCARKMAPALEKDLPEAAANLKKLVARFFSIRLAQRILALNELYASFDAPDPLTFLQIPMACYGFIAARLAGRKEDILALYAQLGEIDMAAGILSYRESLPLCTTPTFTDEGGLRCQGLYHPLLEGTAIPNNADFARDVLLTGSNASGKSTFIKAVALNCLLAQTIHTCNAMVFALAPGFVATSMAVADNVVEGDSYFIAEIKSMRRLIRLAQQEVFSYFFIDEILKGTNTVERVAASSSVLRFLAHSNCLCFAATHDIELTSILAGEYDNYHFRETVTEQGVTFDYKLHTGPSATRNAILLLQRMDFPPNVVAQAHTLVSGFEQKGEWERL